MGNTVSTQFQAANQRRAADRASKFRAGREQHEGLARRSGDFALGRDEEGRVRETRRHGAFHIVVDRWYVRMGFKKEDKEKLEGKPWPEIEARLKDGDIPRKLVRFDTHIISAVRVLKHVRQSYQIEMAKTDELVDALTQANLELANRKKGADGKVRYTDAELRGAVAVLESVAAALESKEVVVKKVVAPARIKETIRKLDEALARPEDKRGFTVGAACSLFVAVRNRLGDWRDKQVAGIVEHNSLRECSMRPERDKWLFAQFARFAEIPEIIRDYCEKDNAKLEVLAQLRRKLRYRKHKQPVLDFMKENAGQFQVKRRDGRDAERLIALAESGVQPKVGMNVDYQLGRFRAIYRCILKDDKARAREHVDSLILFVKANKPHFILEELSKEPDGYLGPVLEALDKAVGALDAKDFAAAKAQFAKARDAISPYAYPQPR
ncbi:MAG: hypothetical protein AB1529_02810 [Candidatus Micrarchaeota archaeon]